MTSTTAPRAFGASSLAGTPRLRKIARGDLVRLQVDAGICPQVLLRVLGLISQQGLVPLNISYERQRHRLRFLIEMDGLSEHSADVLARKVESIVMVRSARLLGSTTLATPSYFGE